jgi:hypothetical protein
MITGLVPRLTGYPHKRIRAHGRAPKGKIGETIRQPRDRLIWQPEERQHSGAKGGRGTDCLRRGVPYFLRAGSSPEDETRLPVFGICRGSASAANRARPEGRAEA